MKKTKHEIEAEIRALKALKPVGQFKDKTAATIAVAIEELETGVDQTAEEWNDLTSEQQDIVQQAVMWKNGEVDDAPSKGWGALVARAAKRV